MTLLALSQKLTAAIQAEPNCILELQIDPAQDEMMAKAGFPIKRTLSDRPADALELQKDWHVAHVTLAGTLWNGEWPRNVLMAGEEIGDDTGYGPSRLIGSSELQDATTMLVGADFGQMFDDIPQSLMQSGEIYGFRPDESEDVLRECAVEALTRLRKFMKTAVHNEHSVLISIT